MKKNREQIDTFIDLISDSILKIGIDEFNCEREEIIKVIFMQIFLVVSTTKTARDYSHVDKMEIILGVINILFEKKYINKYDLQVMQDLRDLMREFGERHRKELEIKNIQLTK